MEDWGNLFEHALNADASPAFQEWLHHRSGWQWQAPADQADHPEEALVSVTHRSNVVLSCIACLAVCADASNCHP